MKTNSKEPLKKQDQKQSEIGLKWRKTANRKESDLRKFLKILSGDWGKSSFPLPLHQVDFTEVLTGVWHSFHHVSSFWSFVAGAGPKSVGRNTKLCWLIKTERGRFSWTRTVRERKLWSCGRGHFGGCFSDLQKSVFIHWTNLLYVPLLFVRHKKQVQVLSFQSL